MSTHSPILLSAQPDEAELRIYRHYAASLLDALEVVQSSRSFTRDLNKSSLDPAMLRDCFAHQRLSLEGRILPIMVHWREVVGEISEATRPHSYRRNSRRLMIRVKNSTWNNELEYQKESLKRSVNKKSTYFEARDLVGQLAKLNPKEWQRYIQIAHQKLDKAPLKREDYTRFAWDLYAHKQERQLPGASQEQFLKHFDRILAHRYQDDLLVHSVGLITGKLYELSETNEGKFHQEMLKQELLEKFQQGSCVPATHKKED